MGEELIYRCNYCGRLIRETKVVTFVDANYALLHCDYQHPMRNRPTLTLKGVAVCIDCLAPFFQEWVDGIKSNPNYIL